MKKESIENKYSIKYIHPSSVSPASEQSYKRYLLLIILLALLLIASFLYKSGYFSNYLQAFVSTTNSSISDKSKLSSDSSDITINKVKINKPKESKATIILNRKISNTTEELTTEIKIRKKISLNQITAKTKDSHNIISNTNTNENKDLINSLDKLTEQLVAARKNDSGLKIKEEQSNNQNLSTLLANPIRKEQIDNKNYLSALNKLDEEKKEENQQIIEVVLNNKINNLNSGTDKNTQNKVPYYTSKNQTTTATKEISDNKTIAVEVTEKTKKNLDYNNTINLSTKSQMDAIILTMKTGNFKTNRPAKLQPKKKPSNKLLTKNNELINQISLQIQTNTNIHGKAEDNNDLISVGLKGKINQLIISKELTSPNYKRALSRESNTRSNAVRSVVVKKGETLWSIAKRAYGDGKYYKKILKANPQLTRKQKLFLVIGQVIRVPK